MSTVKGKRPTKNVPLFDDEVKQNHNLSFSAKAWKKLQHKASLAGVSVSELIAQWVRSDWENIA